MSGLFTQVWRFIDLVTSGHKVAKVRLDKAVAT